MQIYLIVAIARNQVIGREGDIPWHLSTDLRRFKRLTMGHCLVMGRRTYESIGRPLPGRVSIVLSRRPESIMPQEGLLVAGSLEEAIQLVATTRMNHDAAFVIGGADIYRLALPYADRLYLTRVAATVEGDVEFPAVDWSGWQLVEESDFPADHRNDFPHRLEVYERRMN